MSTSNLESQQKQAIASSQLACLKAVFLDRRQQSVHAQYFWLLVKHINGHAVQIHCPRFLHTILLS